MQSMLASMSCRRLHPDGGDRHRQAARELAATLHNLVGQDYILQAGFPTGLFVLSSLSDRRALRSATINAIYFRSWDRLQSRCPGKEHTARRKPRDSTSL